MKKAIKLISIVCMSLFLGITQVKALSVTKVYLFFGEGCQHCVALEEYLDSIKDSYPEMEIIGYEVFNNTDNQVLFERVKKELGTDSKGVPFLVIGNRYLTGFASYRRDDIKAALDYYKSNPYDDVTGKIISSPNLEVVTKDPVISHKPLNMMNIAKQKIIKKIVICIGILLLLLIGYYLITKKERNY